jgi:hypothetical protein
LASRQAARIFLYVNKPRGIYHYEEALAPMWGISFPKRSTVMWPGPPDCYFKSFQSGGGQYSVEVPCAAADAPLLLEWHQTTFVDYLRIALQWGGFPGLARHRPPVLPPELEALGGDLLPL